MEPAPCRRHVPTCPHTSPQTGGLKSRDEIHVPCVYSAEAMLGPSPRIDVISTRPWRHVAGNGARRGFLLRGLGIELQIVNGRACRATQRDQAPSSLRAPPPIISLPLGLHPPTHASLHFARMEWVLPRPSPPLEVCLPPRMCQPGRRGMDEPVAGPVIPAFVPCLVCKGDGKTRQYVCRPSALRPCGS